MANKSSYVVDEHQMILLSSNFQTLLKEAGKYEPNVLINFDSHDDCGGGNKIDKPLFKRIALSRGKMTDEIDIGTWILPSVYWKMFDTIVWVNKFAHVPMADFYAYVYFNEQNEVTVSPTMDGDIQSIPDEWREMWSHCLSSNVPEKHERSKVHVFVLNAVTAQILVPILQRREQYKGKKWYVTVDMDYFSVVNPVKPTWVKNHKGNTSVWDFVSVVSLPYISECIIFLQTVKSTQKPPSSDKDIDKLMWYAHTKTAPNVTTLVYSKLTRDYAKAALDYLPKLDDHDFEILHHAYLPEHANTQDDITYMIDEFDAIINAIDKQNLSFPISIASSFDYSDESERTSREKIIKMCEERYKKS